MKGSSVRVRFSALHKSLKIICIFKDFYIIQTSHTRSSVRTTYCLLCQWLYCILQPLKSGFCHPRTIVIALPHFVFIVISKFCCLWWLSYMPYRELEVPEARYSSFLKGILRSSLLMSRISETLSNVTQRIVAKASRPKMDDTLLNRDISDILSGMYTSET